MSPTGTCKSWSEESEGQYRSTIPASASCSRSSDVRKGIFALAIWTRALNEAKKREEPYIYITSTTKTVVQPFRQDPLFAPAHVQVDATLHRVVVADAWKELGY